MENTNTEGQKFTMADCFITSMFLPKEYDKLLKLKNGKIVRYLFLLMLLVCVIQFAIPTLGSVAGMGGVKNIILNEIPDFSFKDGKLSIGEKLEKTDEVSGIYLVADTSIEKYTREDVPEEMVEAIMVSKTNVLIYNSVYGLGGMVEEMPFEVYKDLSFDNQTFADLSIFIYAGLFFVFVVLYAGTFLQYLIMALFYTVFSFILMKTFMENITFGTIFKIVLFAQSTGMIVQAVTYCINTPLLIMAGSIFSVMITVIILNKVIYNCGKQGIGSL